jgi:glycosyltransferase involved in cell wall biosynthesis
MPEISVILVTQNSAHLLPAVLEGFRRQILPQWQFEIVAVDDGSTDETPQSLNSARTSLPLRLFRQRQAGPGAAKNLGLFASCGTILLFTDDDKVASPDFLLAHLLAHRTRPGPEVAVRGCTRLAPDDEKNPVMRHVTQVGGQLFSHEGMKPGIALSHGTFCAESTSYKRQFLIEHGIFNSELAFGYEDIELGYRLRAGGLQVFYEPEAICTMIRSFSFRDFCARQQQLGRSERAFADLYRTAEVRSLCKIDEGLSLWNEGAGHFRQYMRWVEIIDKMAQLRANAGRPLRPADQTILDDAYRAAFALCRAKGLAMVDDGEARQKLIE